MTRQRQKIEYPIAYLITFTTYGTWLHGDERGSVNKEHNQYGCAFVSPNPSLQMKEQTALRNPPVVLEKKLRKVVLEAILWVCKFRGWLAHAVHVRSNHVHIVVSGDEKPEKMMVGFKAYATRVLTKQNRGGVINRYWANHGSTKYIWDEETLASAVNYVKNKQGKMMEYGKTEP